MIHLLPVNDTGGNSSPYAPVSGFALNPIYMRLQNLPEFDQIQDDTEALHKKYSPRSFFRYNEIHDLKLSILRELYKVQPENWHKKREIQTWIKQNPWIKPYALFKTLKEKNHQETWKCWREWQNMEEEDLENLWTKSGYREENQFHIWVQYHLEQQFLQAIKELNQMGILLKGEIPILLSEDSADVWYYREYFKARVHAGAPPDSESPKGQNWGYPTYNWEILQEDKFQWWHQRMHQYDKFFHALRIDHTQGFFRLWSTQEQNSSGLLGFYTPGNFIKKEELYKIGFDDGRINWLSYPHIYSYELFGALGQEANRIIEVALNQIGSEDLFLFKPFINGEKVIEELPLSQGAKDFLIEQFNNRALIEVSRGNYTPAWNIYQSRSFQSLSPQEQEKLQELALNKKNHSHQLWENQGRTHLHQIINFTRMLICAEDLGVLPESTHRVLRELKIPGIKVLRWTRKWDSPETPFLPMEDYPENSISTLSMHDTTTAREWLFAEDLSPLRRHELGITSEEDHKSFQAYVKVVSRFLENRSKIVLLTIQDVLNLDDQWFYENNISERINTPGTVGDHNWSYRVPVDLDELMGRVDLNHRIKEMLAKKRGTQHD